MKDKKKSFEKLRKRAKAKIAAQNPEQKKRPPADLLHELEVHQAELEIQNEDLRSAQEELAESRRRYFELYELAPVGYFTLDAQGLILEANLKGANLLDRERSRLIRRPFVQHVAPEDHSVFYEHRQQAALSREVQRCELRLLRKGQPFFGLLECRPVFDPDGNLVKLLVTLSDITDRKRLEDALRESEGMYHSLFGNMLDGFAYCKMLFDDHDRPADFIYLEVNNAFERLTGLRNVKGKRVTEVIPGVKESHPELFETYGRVALTGQPERFEIDFTPLGRWLSISVYSPRKNHFVAVFENITERKLAEARVAGDMDALTRMHALSEKLLEKGGIQPLLQEIVNAAVVIMKAEWGTLQLFEGDSLRIVAHHGHQQAFLDSFASAETRGTPWGEATRRGERLIVPDVEKSPLFAGRSSQAVLRERGVRAFQSTPMITRTGALLGVLTTSWGVLHMPDEHDLWRIDLLARQAADLIERSRMEETLRGKTAELSAITETTPVLLTRCSRDLRYLYVNHAYAAMLGSTPEKLAGKPIVEIMGEEGFATIRPRVDKVLQGQTVEYEDEVHFALTGLARWLHVIYVPDRDEHGDVVGWVASINDITERKLAQKALGESEERFRALVTASSEVLYRMSPDWSEMRQLHGRGFLADTERPSRTWLQEYIPPDDQPHVTSAINEAIRTKSIFELEHRVRRVDGSLGWTSSRAIPLLDANGEIAEWFGAAGDITERKRAEEALRKSEERFRSYFELGLIGMAITSPTKGWIEVNGEICKILGYECGEILQKTWAELTHPDDLAADVSQFNRVMDGDIEGYMLDKRFIRKDGQVIDTSISVRAVRGEDGSVDYFLALVQDITERKRAEEALQKSRDELEHRVRDRTERLQESEKRLRELAAELINAQETERKRIALDLHDGLAAQLAAIKYRVEHRYNHAESAEQPFALEETIRDLQSAITETRRIMANLRPSLLDDLGILPAISWYSRETGKSYPGTSVEYSGNVQERDVPDHLKIVIFRVVQESIANAVRHGKSRLIHIGLEKERNWLRLRIEDNGNGFESVKKSTTGGIGLDSMQQRVDSTGGIFSISSISGKGTTVRAEWKIG